MKVTVASTSFSDQSKGWSVIIRDDDGGVVTIECLDERAAVFLCNDLSRSIENYTNYEVKTR